MFECGWNKKKVCLFIEVSEMSSVLLKIVQTHRFNSYYIKMHEFTNIRGRTVAYNWSQFLHFVLDVDLSLSHSIVHHFVRRWFIVIMKSVFPFVRWTGTTCFAGFASASPHTPLNIHWCFQTFLNGEGVQSRRKEDSKYMFPYKCIES